MATAADIQPGWIVRTLPGSGRVSTATFTATAVEPFTIDGVAFVEVHHEGGSHTFAAEAVVIVSTPAQRERNLREVFVPVDDWDD